MTKLKSFLVTSTMACIVGASALTPMAHAQTATPAPTITTSPAITATPQDVAVTPVSFRGGRGGFASLVCNPNGAARLQAMLDQARTQLALTPEQVPLFDTYRTAALAAQTSFADACAKVQTPATGTAPDMLTRMKNRQAVQAAQLDALNAALPSFEAFYTSLSDQQKAAMNPQGRRGGHDRGFDGGRRGGHDRGFDEGRGRDGDRMGRGRF